MSPFPRAPFPRAPFRAGTGVFYNNSSFDGGSSAANAADDGAVAPEKQALLPGLAGSFANVTSFGKGINGIIIDVRGLPAGAQRTADDFILRSGGSLAPAGLGAGPSTSPSLSDAAPAKAAATASRSPGRTTTPPARPPWRRPSRMGGSR